MTLETRVSRPADPAVAEALAGVMFVVEATDFEKQYLWTSHHKNVTWDSRAGGYLVTVGHLDDRPVCLSIWFAQIDGQRVMFFHATSQVVDYRMVDAWLNANCSPTWDAGTRKARTDAQNFHLCLEAIRQRNASEALAS